MVNLLQSAFFLFSRMNCSSHIATELLLFVRLCVKSAKKKQQDTRHSNVPLSRVIEDCTVTQFHMIHVYKADYSNSVHLTYPRTTKQGSK